MIQLEYYRKKELMVFTLYYEGKYIKLSFDAGVSCCEKYNFKIFHSMDKKACIYDMQAVVEQDRKEKQDVLNDLIDGKKLIGWKFDENAAYMADSDQEDEDDTFFDDGDGGITSLDIEFDDCVLVVVCENFHNGYYSHQGYVESTIGRKGELEDDFYEEIKFCI